MFFIIIAYYNYSKYNNNISNLEFAERLGGQIVRQRNAKQPVDLHPEFRSTPKNVQSHSRI